MRIVTQLGLAATCLLFAACNMAANKPQSDKERFSYAVGLQVGQSMKHQGAEIDSKALVQGVQDGLSGAPAKLTDEEIKAAVQAQHQRRAAEREVLAKKNLEAGQAFLAENKKKEGVITLPSGLQYKVLKDGKGKQPKTSDTVEVHYRGTLLNGTEFDSSYKRNQTATFPVGGVIQGWQEVLPLMKEGAKWQVWVPANLAYGERGAGRAIGPNEMLEFEIELLAVKNKK
jgi:FKBP-type peptidyl-prolyl cis-trans isomerase FklB